MPVYSQEIDRAIKLLEAFRAVDPDITLPSMLAFLYVARRDGQSGNQDAVTQELDMSGATASRAVAHWAEYKAPRVAGLDMLESVPDPEDRRYRLITLKRSGLDFVEKLKEVMR